MLLLLKSNGETRGKERFLPFSSQSEGFLDMRETTAHLTVSQLPYFHMKGTDNVNKETQLEHLY